MGRREGQEIAAIRAPSELHGLKTLVVDDSACSRQVLQDILESFTFAVSTVASGEQALAELRRVAATVPYRLVLLDWKMEGMDGFRTAEKIASDPAIAEAGKLPIIIMVTAHGLEMMESRRHPVPVDATLFKPVKPSHLFNTIMALFGKAKARLAHKEPDRCVRLADELAMLRGRRVLVVEDNGFNRDVAVALLEDAGLVVDLAGNGREAVNKTTQSRRGYDAVLMDIQMPEMDGYTATREIRKWEESGYRLSGDTDEKGADPSKPKTKVRQPTPIIAVTAHALKGEKEKCLAEGMNDYLSKPLDEEQLNRMLLKWIPTPVGKGDSTQPPSFSENGQDPARSPALIDKEGALRLLGGRKALYVQMLRRFKQEFGNIDETIRRCLSAGDAATAVRRAHSIKSAAASLGATDLAQASADLEKAAGGKGQVPDGCLERFAMALAETLKAISSLVADANNSEKKAPALARKRIKLPPRATLEEIVRRATRGEYGILSGMLEALECEDIEYSGFCTKIREFAAKYDDDGMAQFIESQGREE